MFASTPILVNSSVPFDAPPNEKQSCIATYAVQVEGLSERATARRFGIDPRTVAKMMRFSVPPAHA